MPSPSPLLLLLLIISNRHRKTIISEAIANTLCMLHQLE